METTLEDVDTLRRFSRTFTERIGVLTDRYLDMDRPLGEARVLFEIGHGISAVADLRSRLRLDAGYLSRTLRSLERQRLVRLRIHPEDGRSRLVELTRAGRDVLAEQDRRASTIAAGLLDGLTAGQRAELVQAVSAAERLLRLASLTFVVAEPRSQAVRTCLSSYAAELNHRFPGGYGEGDLITAEDMSGDAGAFVVGLMDGCPVAGGAIRSIAPAVAEMRHVWVHPDVRGWGVGRRLLAALEREAAARGHQIMRLGTNSVLAEAISMYRRTGYVAIPQYDDEPHADHWFEKQLSEQDGAAGSGARDEGRRRHPAPP